MSTSPNVPEPQDSRVYEVPGTPRWIFAGFIVFIAAFALIGFLLTLADTKRLPSYSSGAYYVGAIQRYFTQ